MILIINGVEHRVQGGAYAEENILQQIQKTLGSKDRGYKAIAHDLHHNLQDSLDGTSDMAGNYFELHNEED